MKERACVCGADFGTDSVRCVIIDAADGSEVSSAVASYTRWSKGLFSDPSLNQFRQHPLDYIEAFEASMREAIARAPGGTASAIQAISVDTTGSTRPCAWATRPSWPPRRWRGVARWCSGAA